MRLKLIVCCFCMCKGKENVREVIGPFSPFYIVINKVLIIYFSNISTNNDRI